MSKFLVSVSTRVKKKNIIDLGRPKRGAPNYYYFFFARVSYSVEENKERLKNMKRHLEKEVRWLALY